MQITSSPRAHIHAGIDKEQKGSNIQSDPISDRVHRVSQGYFCFRISKLAFRDTPNLDLKITSDTTHNIAINLMDC